MALPLTETDKFLLLSAVGAPETRDRISALLDLAGTGNMTGPASATDNALVRYDGTTGALVQNSGALLDDSNNLSGITLLSLTNLRSGDGLATSPVYSFSADTDTGLFRVATNEIGFSTGGTQRLSINSTDITSTLPFYLANGATSVPSLTFASDTNTGIWRDSADDMRMGVGGSERLSLKLTTVEITDVPLRLVDGSVATPSLSFQTETNTGIYLGASNEMSFSVGGTERFRITNIATVNFLPFYASSGTAAAPSITFNSDTDTGEYLFATNSIGWACAGVSVLTLSENQFNFTGSQAVGSSTLFKLNHDDNTNPNSSARHLISSGGSSGGDPYVQFRVGAVQGSSVANFNLGIDNDDSDLFKISVGGSSLSTSQAFSIDALNNVAIGFNVIATTATDGFLYIPTCAGTPTGVPTTFTGRAPLVVDSTNNKLYFYSGGAWRDAGP